MKGFQAVLNEEANLLSVHYVDAKTITLSKLPILSKFKHSNHLGYIEVLKPL